MGFKSWYLSGGAYNTGTRSLLSVFLTYTTRMRSVDAYMAASKDLVMDAVLTKKRVCDHYNYSYYCYASGSGSPDNTTMLLSLVSSRLMRLRQRRLALLTLLYYYNASSFLPSFLHSFIHSFTHLFKHACMHSLIHLFVHSLIPSCIKSFIV